MLLADPFMHNPSCDTSGGRQKRRRVEGLQSLTAQTLLRQIGTGASRVRGALTVASSMVADGFESADVQDMASCGSAGKHPRNAERDLLRWHSP
jgi:hypothetical protein